MPQGDMPDRFDLSDRHGQAALRACGDLLMRVGADGVVRDATTPSFRLMTELHRGGPLVGRRWKDIVAPDSAAAVDTLLKPASGTVWRLVIHRPSDDADVPLLAMALEADAEGGRLIIARDLLQFDLSELLVRSEADIAIAYAAAVQARGTDLESLCLDVLAPAARRLGVEWTADRCNLLEVTEGAWRLQRAVRDLAARDATPLTAADGSIPRILLAPAPGEQHVFGLGLLATFFRRAGWAVWEDHASTAESLSALVRHEWFDVVGLSLTCDSQFSHAAALIRDLRTASRHRRLRVLVGGFAFVTRPERALAIGADATAADARQAVLIADRLRGAEEQPPVIAPVKRRRRQGP